MGGGAVGGRIAKTIRRSHARLWEEDAASNDGPALAGGSGALVTREWLYCRPFIPLPDSSCRHAAHALCRQVLGQTPGCNDAAQAQACESGARCQTKQRQDV